MSETQQAIEQAFQESYGRVLAALIGKFGDFDLAEDALQEAFLTALERWTSDGIPPNPGGWLMVTARNRAIDRLRRERTHNNKLAEIYETPEDEDDLDSIPDQRLKLIFTCCHPALAKDAQVALTLHTLGGLSTEEIARAFLVPVPTMAQRLVRVKRKIKTAQIPYRIPPADLIEERLDAVLSVIYLIFNEGYLSTSGEQLIRYDLCAEAIRLARVLTSLLTNDTQPGESAETLGLLALMLLHDARRNARMDARGEMIVLEDQNRQLWNRQMIDEGVAILEHSAQMRQPGVYQLQAAISAVHSQAARYEDTDWKQIAALYRELYKLSPSPVVNLNWAVAVAMSEGYEYGLRLLDQLNGYYDMSSYVPYHAARADLLRRTGQIADARGAYQRALELTQNQAEQAFFRRRLAELSVEDCVTICRRLATALVR